MDYIDRFTAAYQSSSDIGLEVKCQPLPFKGKLSSEEIRRISTLCADYLYSIGLKCSSDLAAKCIPVHMQLQDVLRAHLGVESYITIGDRFWSDYVYCEMSYQDIKSEIKNPDVKSPLKAHVWLTLSDGSVLDCTGEAHLDLILKRGEQPTHGCIGYIPSDKTPTDGYYRPYLVGDDFLRISGAFAVVS